MELEYFTNEDNFYHWITMPVDLPAGEKPPKLYVKIPGELELSADWQACRKKEVLTIPNNEEPPRLAGRNQRRAFRPSDFHVDDSDTDFIKLAEICADKYLEDWQGFVSGKDKDRKPVPFNKQIFKEKILPRPGVGMWFVNTLFDLSQNFSVYQKEQKNIEKKI